MRRRPPGGQPDGQGSESSLGEESPGVQELAIGAVFGW